MNHNLVGSASPAGILVGQNESDLYIGYKLPVYEKLSADVGFTYYWYTSNALIDFRREIYAGLIYNGFYVNPAAYVYYDFDREAITGELSGKYSWDLAKYGWANTALDVGAYVGGVSASNSATDQVNSLLSISKQHDGYMYYGVTADLVYSFTKNAAASVGIRYAGNNDGGFAGGTGGLNALVDRENSFWWGAKFSAGF